MVNKITKPITDKERDDKTNEIIDELSNKQSALTAGANINIENNVISATNDALVTIDSSLSTTSTNPVQNKVVTGALSSKAEDNSVVHTTGNETITGMKTLDGWLKLKDSNNSNGETILRVNSNNKLSDLDDNVYAYMSDIPQVDIALSTTSTKPVQNKVVTSALDGKLDKSGGTMTGNLTVGSSSIGTNGYIQGTWLQTTSASINNDLTTVVMINDNGWIYKQSKDTLLGGKVDKTSIVSTVSSSSTNSQVVGAKLFFDIVGDIETALNTINSGV